MDVEERVRDLMEKITFYVFRYYEIFESIPVYADPPQLPIQLRAVILRSMIITLADPPLLQLTEGFVNATHRTERMVTAYVRSYHIEFTDEYFMEWVVRITTLSAFLYHRGVLGALQVSIDTVTLITITYNRFQAFRSLGCNV